jgi:hypothetical protein
VEKTESVKRKRGGKGKGKRNDALLPPISPSLYTQFAPLQLMVAFGNHQQYICNQSCNISVPQYISSICNIDGCRATITSVPKYISSILQFITRFILFLHLFLHLMVALQPSHQFLNLSPINLQYMSNKCQSCLWQPSHQCLNISAINLAIYQSNLNCPSQFCSLFPGSNTYISPPILGQTGQDTGSFPLPLHSSPLYHPIPLLGTEEAQLVQKVASHYFSLSTYRVCCLASLFSLAIPPCFFPLFMSSFTFTLP